MAIEPVASESQVVVEHGGATKGKARSRRAMQVRTGTGKRTSGDLKRMASGLAKLVRSKRQRPKVAVVGNRMVLTLDRPCSFLVYQSVSTSGVRIWRTRGTISPACMEAITASGFRFGKEQGCNGMRIWLNGGSPEAMEAVRR